jgi:protein transport protein SEC61 subunit alpha
MYLWRFKLYIKVTNKKMPGVTYNQPIKLFYSSTTPIIVINTFISNLYLVSQVLYRRYSSSLLIKILGTWAEKNGEQVATGGIAYFITPPKNLFYFITHPLKSIIYVIFILYFSGWFTQTMVDLIGKGAIDLARGLKNEGFFLEGIRESEETIYKRFQKLIPTVSFLSGMLIAALQILADLIGAIGSGTGILLLVSTILQVQENNEGT